MLCLAFHGVQFLMQSNDILPYSLTIETRWYPDGGTVSAAGPSRPYFPNFGNVTLYNEYKSTIFECSGGGGEEVLWKPNFEH